MSGILARFNWSATLYGHIHMRREEHFGLLDSAFPACFYHFMNLIFESYIDGTYN